MRCSIAERSVQTSLPNKKLDLKVFFKCLFNALLLLLLLNGQFNAPVADGIHLLLGFT